MPRPTAFSDRNLEIYDRHTAGESRQALAEAYGVGPTRIAQIISRIGASRHKEDLANGQSRWEELHDLRQKVESLTVHNERLREQNKLLFERLRQIRNLTNTE
jgi:ribosomal protein S13